MRSQNNNIVKLIVFALFLTMAYTLVALDENNDYIQPIKIRPESIKTHELKQPDGTTVVLEGVTLGRNNHFMFRKDGFTVVHDSESRYYCWAYQDENGTLSSTGYPVHLYDPEKLGLVKDIRMTDEGFQIAQKSPRIKQPDGIWVNVDRISGRNIIFQLNQKYGYTIVPDHKTGYMCWARRAENGDLEPTEYPFHLHNPEDLGLEKDLRMTDEAFKSRLEEIEKYNLRDRIRYRYRR